MKRIMVMVMLVALVAGCKAQKKETVFQGVEENTDYIMQGVQYLSQRDFAKAMQSFDLAIKAEPTNVDNYLTIGQIYLRLKNYEQAKNLFSAAVKLAPLSGQGYFFLAISEQFLGNQEAAIEEAKKSAIIFSKQRDQAGFRRAVILIQDLTAEEDTPGAEVEEPMAKTETDDLGLF